MPAEAGEVCGTPATAQLEVEHTQQTVSVGDRPAPIAALPFHTAQSRELLLHESEPVTVGRELLDFETTSRELMFIPVTRESGAVVMRGEVNDRGERCGEYQFPTTF